MVEELRKALIGCLILGLLTSGLTQSQGPSKAGQAASIVTAARSWRARRLKRQSLPTVLADSSIVTCISFADRNDPLGFLASGSAMWKRSASSLAAVTQQMPLKEGFPACFPRILHYHAESTSPCQGLHHQHCRHTTVPDRETPAITSPTRSDCWPATAFRSCVKSSLDMTKLGILKPRPNNHRTSAGVS